MNLRYQLYTTKMKFQVLTICCVLGLGSSWTQPNTCYVRQSSALSGLEYLREEIKTLRETLESHLASISTSLQELVAQGATTTEPPQPIGTYQNPASSCRDIPPDSPSGEYWIQGRNNSLVKVYCDMDRTSCSCNTTRGWMRVADLDMTDSSQNCPEDLRLTNRSELPLRLCGRQGEGCSSTFFQVYGLKYSHVCGRIRGYQDGSTDAFWSYFRDNSLTIDSAYVDGLSLTHGQFPREHIWSFVAALDETHSDLFVCPCTQTNSNYTGLVPPFVGQDYFCETGSRDEASSAAFYADDPLWNGQGCGGNSTCCEFNNPPWFCKQLPQPTTDDIELRLCSNRETANEDPLVELIEIYVR